MSFNPCEAAIYLYLSSLLSTSLVDLWAHCEAVVAVYESSPKSRRLAEVCVCRQLLANWDYLLGIWTADKRVQIKENKVYFRSGSCTK